MKKENKEFNLSEKIIDEVPNFFDENGFIFKKDIKEFIKLLKEEFKIVEESADFDSYDLSDKTEKWKSGFRRAMLLVNNCIDIYKYHRDKLAGEKLI